MTENAKFCACHLNNGCACSTFNDSGSGWCLVCGHEEECHEHGKFIAGDAGRGGLTENKREGSAMGDATGTKTVSPSVFLDAKAAEVEGQIQQVREQIAAREDDICRLKLKIGALSDQRQMLLNLKRESIAFAETGEICSATASLSTSRNARDAVHRVVSLLQVGEDVSFDEIFAKVCEFYPPAKKTTVSVDLHNCVRNGQLKRSGRAVYQKSASPIAQVPPTCSQSKSSAAESGSEPGRTEGAR